MFRNFRRNLVKTPTTKIIDTYPNNNVANYLYRRLQDFNVKTIFGVPGNYTAAFLNSILEDKSTDMKLVTMSNELVAGYAADGYARVQGPGGLGVVHVTYGVGAFSLLNATAGSYVENVPVVVINGAPTNKEFRTFRYQNLQYQHIAPNPNSNLDVFRNVTCSSHIIEDANDAPLQIELALHRALTQMQPVYLEVREDVWRTPITEYGHID